METLSSTQIKEIQARLIQINALCEPRTKLPIMNINKLTQCYADLLESEHNFVTVFSGFYGSYALFKQDVIYFIIKNDHDEITAYLHYNLVDTFETETSDYAEYIQTHHPVDLRIHDYLTACDVKRACTILDDELELNNNFVIKQGYLETILLHKYNGIIYEITVGWSGINSYAII